MRRSDLGIVLLGVLLRASEDELAALDGLLLLGQGLLLLLDGPLLLALLLAEHRLWHRHLRHLGRHLHVHGPKLLSHRSKRAANSEGVNGVRRGRLPYLDELGRRGVRGESGGQRLTQAAAGVGRAGYVGGVLSLGFVEVIRRQRIIWARGVWWWTGGLVGTCELVLRL